MNALFRIALLSLPLVTLTSGARAAETLQIATSAGGSSAVTAAVAEQLGYFSESGLNVALFDAGGGNNAVSTVVNGGAQIGIVGIRNASKPVEKGQDLKLIALDTNALTQYVVIRSSLVNPENAPKTLTEKGALLHGKKIAVNDIGGSSGEFARYALAAAGFGERDAEILNINSIAARLTALKAGRIDAIVDSAPAPETAIADGYGTMLIDPTRDIPQIRDIASTVYLVRADYLRDHASVLKVYLNAIEKARILIKSDPKKAESAYYAFLHKESNGADLDPKIKEAAWKEVVSATAPSLTLSAGQYARAQSFFKIPAVVSYTKFVDNTLAETFSKSQ